MGSGGWVAPNKILVDAEQNIYACGTFSQTTDLDPGPGIYTITPEGGYDGFLMKLNRHGVLLWVKHFKGPGLNTCSEIKFDVNGDLWLSGFAQDSVDVDPGPGKHMMHNSRGTFLCKYNRSGELLLSVPLGNFHIVSFLIDKSLNIYFTGSVSGKSDFDPGPDSLILTTDNTDFHITKFDAYGNLVWVKKIGGASHDYSYDMIMDSKENILITGSFRDCVDFDPSVDGITTACADQLVNEDFFILKLDPNGGFEWVQTNGLYLNDRGLKIRVDKEDNIYCLGTFTGWFDFDKGAGNNVLTSDNDDDVFLLKLDQDGAFQWVKGIRPTTWYEWPHELLVDKDLKVYLAGYFDGGCNFDIMSDDTKWISGRTGYVCSYGKDGENLCFGNFESTSSSQCLTMALDEESNIYTAGIFSGTANFSSVYSNMVMTSASRLDMFISKLGPCLIPEKEGRNYPGEDYLEIYPNPSSGLFYVGTENLKDVIIVENNLGVEVYRKEMKDVTGNKFVTLIDLTSLPAGMYFLKVPDFEFDKRISRKIIIQ
jgi:hypothetical protein